MKEGTAILPDFECTACGYGSFGKEPLHCPKCGGTNFNRLRVAGGAPIERVAGALRRIGRDVAGIRMELKRCGHRRGKALEYELRKIDLAAARALRLIHSTVDAFAVRRKAGGAK